MEIFKSANNLIYVIFWKIDRSIERYIDRCPHFFSYRPSINWLYQGNILSSSCVSKGSLVSRLRTTNGGFCQRLVVCNSEALRVDLKLEVVFSGNILIFPVKIFGGTSLWSEKETNNNTKSDIRGWVLEWYFSHGYIYINIFIHIYIYLFWSYIKIYIRIQNAFAPCTNSSYLRCFQMSVGRWKLGLCNPCWAGLPHQSIYIATPLDFPRGPLGVFGEATFQQFVIRPERNNNAKSDMRGRVCELYINIYIFIYSEQFFEHCVGTIVCWGAVSWVSSMFGCQSVCSSLAYSNNQCRAGFPHQSIYSYPIVFSKGLF